MSITAEFTIQNIYVKSDHNLSETILWSFDFLKPTEYTVDRVRHDEATRLHRMRLFQEIQGYFLVFGFDTRIFKRRRYKRYYT